MQGGLASVGAQVDSETWTTSVCVCVCVCVWVGLMIITPQLSHIEVFEGTHVIPYI